MPIVFDEVHGTVIPESPPDVTPDSTSTASTTNSERQFHQWLHRRDRRLRRLKAD